jgi:citrate lyase subunit beta/citryl-CoA lyase
MIEKAAGALILDLADSVPPDMKAEARGIVQGKRAWLADQGQRAHASTNRSPHRYDFDDVLAVIGAHLEGVVISKPCGSQDVDLIASLAAEAEYCKGLPLGGLWQHVHDLAGLRTSSEADRALGMTGELLSHPCNVAAANQVFSPAADEVAFYRSMIAAHVAAQVQERASCIVDSEHIDAAHVETAREVIALAA